MSTPTIESDAAVAAGRERAYGGSKATAREGEVDVDFKNNSCATHSAIVELLANSGIRPVGCTIGALCELAVDARTEWDERGWVAHKVVSPELRIPVTYRSRLIQHILELFKVGVYQWSQLPVLPIAVPVIRVNPPNNHSAKLMRDSSVGFASILPRIAQAWNRKKSFKTAMSGTSTPLPRQHSLTVLSSGAGTPLRAASSHISSSFHLEL
jgi:hypothetical protein